MTTDEDHPELVQTHALADGELRGEELAQAQEHLATCARCQAELAEVMQLEAMPMPRPSNVVSLAWYRRRAVQATGMALFAAAAVAVLYVGKHPAAIVEHHDTPKVALAEKRAIEARMSWSGASDYRVYSVPRGQSLAKEPISLAAMADLEKAGDLHGVGALALLGGDLEQAKKYLALAGETPAVMADHAALELQLGHPEAALVLADNALAKAPDDPIATWNRALALRDLGLNHGAAEAFRAVAKHAEAGWAAEATQRADVLEKSFVEEIRREVRIWLAAKPLLTTQSGLTPDDAGRMPGVARIELYDAMRAAPSAEALAKLKPLAEAIDAGEQSTSTTEALNRQKPDPIAAKAYLDLTTSVSNVGPNPDVEKHLATLRARKANDALVVAFLKLPADGVVLDKDLPELSRLAAASSDPWIQLIGIEQRGANAFKRNDLAASEAALLEAKPLCAAGGPKFRCMKIALRLGRTYLAWQRLPEARAMLLDANARARTIASRWDESETLTRLTQVALLSDDAHGGGLSLVRAYASEVAARNILEINENNSGFACDPERWMRERIATELILQLRPSDAAKELASAPKCRLEVADQAAAELFVRGEILHLAGTPAQLAEFRADVTDARGRPELTAGGRALIDHAEGRALIGSDPVTGEKLLRQAIADAKAAPNDSNASHAAGASYATLAVAAGKRGDAAAMFALLGEELKVSARASCVLGLVLDDRDVVVVARDGAGKSIVDTYERAPSELVGEKIVPGRVIDALKACPDVDVIARPPFHGLARILPDDIAWRYLTPRARPVGESTGSSLVIADVEPPKSLGLPRLSSWTTTDATVMSGPTATPSRVLAAIGSAKDVLINAHGLADSGEASYLALSPEADGRYALTAAQVERAKFASNPLVILAACEAAKAAPVFHELWSLPASFITAGARAVVAPTSAIPDSDAAAFFGELRSRALGGQPLAVVLRDLRKKWLVAPNTNFWVRDVVVFE